MIWYCLYFISSFQHTKKVTYLYTVIQQQHLRQNTQWQLWAYPYAYFKTSEQKLHQLRPTTVKTHAFKISFRLPFFFDLAIIFICTQQILGNHSSRYDAAALAAAAVGGAVLQRVVGAPPEEAERGFEAVAAVAVGHVLLGGVLLLLGLLGL